MPCAARDGRTRRGGAMRKVLQPGLLAMLVLALAALPALASDWRPYGRSTVERSSGNQVQQGQVGQGQAPQSDRSGGVVADQGRSGDGWRGDRSGMGYK